MRALSPKTEQLYAYILGRAGYGTSGWEKGIESWPESVRKVLRKAILRFWIEQGNEAKGRADAALVKPKFAVRRVVRYPSEEELDRFEEAAASMRKPYVRIAIRILLGLGLRRDEFLSLSRGQVEHGLSTGQLVFVRKGGIERVLPVDPVRDEFRELLTLPRKVSLDTPVPEPWEYVGEVLARKQPHKALHRLVKKIAYLAGLDASDWSAHKLRHGFATRMNAAGVPTRTLQALLGHSSIATTERYTHVSVDAMRDALRALKKKSPEVSPGAP